MSKKKNKNGNPAVKKAQNTPAVKNQPAKVATPDKKVDFKEVARIAAILMAICLVITGLLAVTNALTSGKIAENSLVEKQNSCAEVLTADSFVELSDERFPDYDVYIAITDGNVSGAVITTTDKGYGGELQVMTGIDMNGNITGVKLLEHSETPGLGGNAQKPYFVGQFVTDWQNGETRPEQFAVSKDGGTIDAVTAATISSRAVTRAVNSAIGIFDELMAAGALVLPEGYTAPQVDAPSVSDIASPSDTTAVVSPADADNNGEIDTVPTIVAGGVQ